MNNIIINKEYKKYNLISFACYADHISTFFAIGYIELFIALQDYDLGCFEIQLSLVYHTHQFHETALVGHEHHCLCQSLEKKPNCNFSFAALY